MSLRANLTTCLGALLVLTFCSCSLTSSNQGPDQVYFNYHKARKASDLQGIKKVVTSEKLKEFETAGATAKFEIIKPGAPEGEVTIVHTQTVGPISTLTLEARVKNQAVNGTAKMKKEGEIWKIFDENWQGQSTFPSPQAVKKIVVEQPFFKDPKQPPNPQVILQGHGDTVSHLVFTPDCRFLVSISSGDHTLRVWDVQAGGEKSTARLEHRPTCLAVTSDGRTIITADSHQEIMLWPLEEGVIGRSKLFLKDAGKTFALSLDNKQIAVADGLIDNGLRDVTIYNFKDGTEIKRMPDTKKVRMIAFSPSGKLLATCGDQKNVMFWDVEKGEGKPCESSRKGETTDATSFAFSHDGKFLAATLDTGGGFGYLTVWDVEKRKESYKDQSTDFLSIRDAQFSPNDHLLVTVHALDSNRQNTVQIRAWEPPSLREGTGLKMHKDSASCLAFSPDGRTLATGSADFSIILWRDGASPPSIEQQAGQVLRNKLAGTIPGYQELEASLLQELKEFGPLEHPEWFLEELDHSWKDAVHEWESSRDGWLSSNHLNQTLYETMAKEKLDPNIPEEKKLLDSRDLSQGKEAKIKSLKGGEWSYQHEIPKTEEGIAECWVKHTVTLVSSRSAQVGVGVAQVWTTETSEPRWFKYSWDVEEMKWVEYPAAQKRQVRGEMERTYLTEKIPEQIKMLEHANPTTAAAQAQRKKEHLERAHREYERFLQLSEKAAASHNNYDIGQARYAWNLAAKFVVESDPGFGLKVLQTLQARWNEDLPAGGVLSTQVENPPAPGGKPAPSTGPTIPAEVFKVNAVMGATVLFTDKTSAEVGKEFNFKYQGKTYLLKVLSISENRIEIQQGTQTISVPY